MHTRLDTKNIRYSYKSVQMQLGTKATGKTILQHNSKIYRDIKDYSRKYLLRQLGTTKTGYKDRWVQRKLVKVTGSYNENLVK